MAHYIDKDAVLALIERRIKEREEEEKKGWIHSRVQIVECEHILSDIDSLEVKEVNLDEEIEKCLKQHNMLAVGKKDFADIAKHFFELGLNTKNAVEIAREEMIEKFKNMGCSMFN